MTRISEKRHANNLVSMLELKTENK